LITLGVRLATEAGLRRNIGLPCRHKEFCWGMVTRFSRLFFVFVAFTVGTFASPAKWKADIDVFLANDAAHPPPQNAVVFVGSSSIVKWKSLTADFPTFPVINRGFGGSELADSVAYVDQIVVPYHPRAVVLYAGDNDLASGKTPEAVLSDFRAFRTKVHAALPSARIFYLAIKFSPSRAKLQSAMQHTNELIAADCTTTDHCTFVDVNTPMLDAAGHPRPELFESDQLHIKLSTYALWVHQLAPLLSP
jgi:lysophospholipase L1-like esterase